jgi:hypothetical protein
LAPGVLPRVRISTPIYYGFSVGILITWIVLIIGLCAGLHKVAAFAGLGSLICYIGVWTIGRSVLPSSVKFPGLETFRDLSKIIAQGARP